MARKKGTPATSPGLPDDLQARLLEGVARGIKADMARRNALRVNIDPIDTSPLLHAAAYLLDRHEMFLELAEGVGHFGRLFFDVKQGGEKLLKDLEAAGLIGSEMRTYYGHPDKTTGIVTLISGVYRLLGAIEQSPFAVGERSWSMGRLVIFLVVPAGEVFHFDAGALAEIKVAVRLLQSAARQAQIVPPTLQQDMCVMREAISEMGRDASPPALRRVRPMSNQRARVALRELQKLGEYEGFQRETPRRYRRSNPPA